MRLDSVFVTREPYESFENISNLSLSLSFVLFVKKERVPRMQRAG